MVALNFKRRFAGDVETRIKKQSIRGRAITPGKSIQLYTGQRTKACRKLVAQDPVCVNCRSIIITVEYVVIEGWRLAYGDIIELARLDGFSSPAEFIGFFCPRTKRFEGYLIEWDWAV